MWPFRRRKKSIVKVSAGGSLYITTEDLFSQPEVQQTLRDLENSSIAEQIRKYGRTL